MPLAQAGSVGRPLPGWSDGDSRHGGGFSLGFVPFFLKPGPGYRLQVTGRGCSVVAREKEKKGLTRRKGKFPPAWSRAAGVRAEFGPEVRAC